MNLVVPSPYETEPHNNAWYQPLAVVTVSLIAARVFSISPILVIMFSYVSGHPDNNIILLLKHEYQLR